MTMQNMQITLSAILMTILVVMSEVQGINGQSNLDVQTEDTEPLDVPDTKVENVKSLPQYQDVNNFDKDLVDAVSEVQSFQLRALFQKERMQNGEIVKTQSNYRKQCGLDRHCFDVQTKALECRNETCQCRVWKQIELEWKEDREDCLSAKGHPCITDKMCHSDKCDKLTLKCSTGASIIRLGSIQLSNVLIDLAFYLLLPGNVITLTLF